MTKSTQQEQSGTGEGIRNTLIVLLIFGVIAIISYLEWKGKLGH